MGMVEVRAEDSSGIVGSWGRSRGTMRILLGFSGSSEWEDSWASVYIDTIMVYDVMI